MTTFSRAVDGLPSVTGTTERALRFPAPANGQKVHNLDTGTIEEYRDGVWSPVLGGLVAVNVLSKGAKADGTDTTDAQDAAFASLPSTGGIIIYPPGSFKRATNLFAGLSSNVPCVVLLQGAEVLTDAQVIVPRESRVTGIGRGNSRDSGIGHRGGVIRANTSVFPNNGTAVVRLGPSGSSGIFGCRLENVTVDCGGLSNSLGVYSTNINEQSGLEHVLIYNAQDGVKIEASGSEKPLNWSARDLEIMLRTGSVGTGVYVDGGNNASALDIRRATVTLLGQVAVAGSRGYRFNGLAGGVAVGLHAEAVETGLVIGDLTGKDVNGVTIIGITTALAGMTDGVKIDTVSSVRDLTLIGIHSGSSTNTLRDLVNGVTYLSASYPRIGLYAIGSLSGGGASRKVITSVGELRQALTYGTTVNTNCQKGLYCTLTVTDAVAFTIANPTNAIDGDDLYFEIFNSSGGAMGTITWGSEFVYRDTWTNPANNKRRVIHFKRRGTSWAQAAAVMGDM